MKVFSGGKMAKKPLLHDATLPVQKCLLFMVLSLELAACHLMTAGYLYLSAAGVSGLSLLLPMFGVFGILWLVVTSNIASIIISIRILYFEKDDNGWGSFARITLPVTTAQTGVLLIVFLFYPMHVQFVVGCIGLMMGVLFFLLLRHYAKTA